VPVVVGAAAAALVDGADVRGAAIDDVVRGRADDAFRSLP